MRSPRIRFIRVKFLVRATFKLMIGLSLAGALAGALLMANLPAETRVLFDNTLLDPPLAVAVGAVMGAFCGVFATLLLLILAAVVGIVLPAILAVVLALVAVVLALTVVCVVGAIAMAFSPFLLLGLGCVLLFRALSRRGHVPEPITYPSI